MKKIVLLVALCLCVGNLFAQDADKLRSEWENEKNINIKISTKKNEIEKATHEFRNFSAV